MSAIVIGLSGGCASTTRFVVARELPSPLADERRPGVAFGGPIGRPEVGDALARAVAERLRAAGLDPVLAPPGEAPGASVVGVVEELDAHAGRVVVSVDVVDPRRAEARPLPTIELTAIGDDVIGEAAARIVSALLSGSAERTTIEWEDAGEWDAVARARMDEGDVAGALAALEASLPRAKSAAVDAETLAALHYDLGLCLDLLGRWAEAERALDEALTLHGTERHIDALRTLRRRKERAGDAGGAP